MGWFTKLARKAAQSAEPSVLDMSEAAKLGRAVKQGFDVDTPWFHAGNLGDELSADAGELGLHIGNQDAARMVAQRGITRRPKPEVSSLLVRGNFALTPDLGNFRTPFTYRRARGEMPREFDSRYQAMWQELDAVANKFENGYKQGAAELEGQMKQWRTAVHNAARKNDVAGWEYINNAEGGGEPSRVVFDTTSVRKSDAAFDPSQSGSSKLLAAIPIAAGGGLLSRWALQNDQDQYI